MERLGIITRKRIVGNLSAAIIMKLNEVSLIFKFYCKNFENNSYNFNFQFRRVIFISVIKTEIGLDLTKSLSNVDFLQKVC